jgi:serine/threonine-protein phosphatase 2A regulatory subunit B'
MKTQSLMHMIEYFNLKLTETFPDAIYPLVVDAVAVNILRPVPPPSNPEGEEYDPEEDEDALEPAWPHISLVYEMFIKFLEIPNFNVALARKYIDSNFVARLMALFDLEDPRERDVVKTALHRTYGKFLNLRPVIRKMMRSVFCELVYENVRHKIAEMLEILGSIINGFALPIRPEHQFFLEKSLIPLHKHRSLPCYQSQLAFCINQFVEKDQELADMVVMGLLRIWPKINSTKEVLFLTEIEDVLLLLDPEYFEPFADPLFVQLGKCIESSHFQVSEKALMFWHNEEILELFNSQHRLMIEIITPSLLRLSSTHWNANVKLLMVAVIQIFMKLDPKFFNECAINYSKMYHIDPEQEAREINQMVAMADSSRSNSMDIVASEGPDDEKENPEPKPQPSPSSIRRKSMLPVNTDVASALANFRPSPPPSEIPDKS